MRDDINTLRPDEAPAISRTNAEAPPRREWQGQTYYGRSQLKPAPFENWVVGGYIFLAGLSGAAAMIAALLDASQGRIAAARCHGEEPSDEAVSLKKCTNCNAATEAAVRRGRYFSMLAPIIGSALLVWDLHTPKRFYNMLRIAKRTSPMSIGTWILMSFTAFAGASAVTQFLSERIPRLRWLRRASRVTQVPAAVAGAGLSTYTASLLSATSTPLWAAAPREMAVRFGSSSVAAGASALSLGEPPGRLRRRLDALTVAALAAELAATVGSHRTYQQKGVAGALDGPWGQVEDWGATKLGVVAPLVLHSLSLFLSPRLPSPRRPSARPSATLSALASLGALAGSLLLRVSIMGAGDESARRPDISFRFAQPGNLPGHETTSSV